MSCTRESNTVSGDVRTVDGDKILKDRHKPHHTLGAIAGNTAPFAMTGG